MTKDEALKMALEHFETWTHEDSIFAGEFDKEITAIKEALAQPERDYERGFIDGMQKQMQSSVDKAVNAMAQRTWVGLTSEEIGEIYRVGWANNMELARAIEAKLKEKNVGTL